MLVVPTGVDGVELVHRRLEEPAIAELTAPRAMPAGCRTWGIRYRDGNAPAAPFGGSFNYCPRNRQRALADVEQAIRVCSDFQLGLTAP